MKLCRDKLSNVIHIIDPIYIIKWKPYRYITLNNYKYSFCGLVGQWPNMKNIMPHKFFNGTSDQVNCGTCKVMAHNYILRKFKGEN